jgi:hypothetical protein
MNLPSEGLKATEPHGDEYQGALFVKLLYILKPNFPRKFTFEKANLALRSGLKMDIQGFHISENPIFGEEDFLCASHADLTLQILPLLIGKIHLKKVSFDQPIVRLIRNAEGTFNIKDIIQGTKGKGKTGSPKAPLLDYINVSNVLCRNGQLFFIDELPTKGRVSLSMDAFDLALKELPQERMFQIFLGSRLSGSTTQRVMIRGNLGSLAEHSDIISLPMDLELTLHDFPLSVLTPYVPEGFPLAPVSGIVGIDLHLNGSLASIVSALGEMRCKELILRTRKENVNTAPISLCVRLHENTRLGWQKGTVAFDRVEIVLNENTLLVKGSLEGLGENPTWNIALIAHALKMAELMKVYPPAEEIVPEDVHTSGGMDIEVEASGTRENLEAHGDLEMKDMKVTSGALFEKPRSAPLHVSLQVRVPADGAMVSAGTFQMAQGEFMKTGFVELLLCELLGLKRPLRSHLKRTSSFEKDSPTDFESMTGDFSITGNKSEFRINVHNMYTSRIEGAEAHLDGTISLDDGALSLRGELILSHKDSIQCVKDTAPLHVVRNLNGNIVLPFVITGSLKEPRASLDSVYVAGLMGR